ncbi:tRNA (N(6)-L-threonylcarbamoyladenosine(37)-C(2))-methylthiotransferase MtaB [Haliangium sp.]|uniref:tRNA (N(6)-L-threonylcarbamoyladenosine(37)-C(2))- methylthiotransferase MtaB n=1 Tax=Haliangium sp. TaxID=2663208 RepID=UPI003D0C4D67
MNVFLTSLGCRLNEAELARWAREFHRAGHRVLAQPEQAQVVVVNTCAVTAEAARKSRKLVGGLHRRNPEARLVLTGCFAELEPTRAAALAGVDLVVGNGDKDRLVAEVAEAFEVPGMPALAAEPDSAHAYRECGRTRAFIKVQDGCKNRCTFCIVTIARGQERSRAIDEVVAEIQSLAAAGYQEAVLTGVHLGGYGRDLGTDLARLVREVLARTDIPRLRLSSLEPWDLPAGFFALWHDRRLMPHLHLPLQSGSDRILQRMARRSSTRDFTALVEDARAAIPDLTVTTDMIVGFPGEGEAEWAETMAYVDGIGFAHVHIFPYSPREGTTAARLDGQVPGPVKRERSRQMHALAADMKRAHLARFAGQTREVLWEGEGEPRAAGTSTTGATATDTGGAVEAGAAPAWHRFGGYTDNYLRVETAVPAGVSLDNRITPARLLGVHGELLRAETVEHPLAAAP